MGLHADTGIDSLTSCIARAAQDDERHEQAFAPVRGRHGAAAYSIEFGILRALRSQTLERVEEVETVSQHVL